MRAFTISLIFMVAFAEAGVCQPVAGSRVVVHLRGADGRLLPDPVTIRADRIDCTERRIILARGSDIVALFDPAVVAFVLREEGAHTVMPTPDGASALDSGLAPGSNGPGVLTLPNQGAGLGEVTVTTSGGVGTGGGVLGDQMGPEAQIRAILSTALFRYLSAQLGGGKP